MWTSRCLRSERANDAATYTSARTSDSFVVSVSVLLLLLLLLLTSSVETATDKEAPSGAQSPGAGAGAGAGAELDEGKGGALAEPSNAKDSSALYCRLASLEAQACVKCRGNDRKKSKKKDGGSDDACADTGYRRAHSCDKDGKVLTYEPCDPKKKIEFYRHASVDERRAFLAPGSLLRFMLLTMTVFLSTLPVLIWRRKLRA